MFCFHINLSICFKVLKLLFHSIKPSWNESPFPCDNLPTQFLALTFGFPLALSISQKDRTCVVLASQSVIDGAKDFFFFFNGKDSTLEESSMLIWEIQKSVKSIRQQHEDQICSSFNHSLSSHHLC